MQTGNDARGPGGSATFLNLLRSAVTPAGSGHNQPSGKGWPSCLLSTISLSSMFPTHFDPALSGFPPPPYPTNSSPLLPCFPAGRMKPYFVRQHVTDLGPARAGDVMSQHSKRQLGPYQGQSRPWKIRPTSLIANLCLCQERGQPLYG